MSCTNQIRNDPFVNSHECKDWNTRISLSNGLSTNWSEDQFGADVGQPIDLLSICIWSYMITKVLNCHKILGLQRDTCICSQCVSSRTNYSTQTKVTHQTNFAFAANQSRKVRLLSDDNSVTRVMSYRDWEESDSAWWDEEKKPKHGLPAAGPRGAVRLVVASSRQLRRTIGVAGLVMISSPNAQCTVTTLECLAAVSVVAFCFTVAVDKSLKIR